jgi:hypothetical protein
MVHTACCDFCRYAALGANKAYHYAEVKGAAGQILGRVRYGYSVKLSLDSAIKAYRETQAAARSHQQPTSRPLTTATKGGGVQGGAAPASPLGELAAVAPQTSPGDGNVALGGGQGVVGSGAAQADQAAAVKAAAALVSDYLQL